LKELKAVEIEIQRWKEYILNAELIKESSIFLKNFSSIKPARTERTFKDAD